MKPDEHQNESTHEDTNGQTVDLFGRHLAAICREAGLQVMEGILDVLVDREELGQDVLIALDALDVRMLHDKYIYPAINRLEVALLDRNEDAR